jgi:hypothetical protein
MMTNARKSREKHRRERELITEEERKKMMMESYQVYKCSGGLDHNPDCPGDCGTERLSDLDIAIHQERKRWDELGMSYFGSLRGTGIPGVPVDVFLLEVSLFALIEYLQEKGVIEDQEEVDNIFRKTILERMTRIREANEEDIKRSRRQAGIALPVPELSPEIIIPDNIKRKMH